MNVLVVYYSLYGHNLKMAGAARDGAKSVSGVDVAFRRIAEFPETEEWIQTNPHAKVVWEQQKDTPVCTLDDLRKADGLVLASPTRFGNMTAQVKRLIDSAAPLWLEGTMEGKPAGVLTSTATTHGGQETTLLSMMIPLLHLGMIIVGVPYSTPGMLHTEGRGGTPYGATTTTGPKNDLVPPPEDIEIAKALGRRVAQCAVKLRGR
ncbi:MAG: NAD(P)H:quinone oxidoreductase [Phycisphaerales bacterium]